MSLGEVVAALFWGILSLALLGSSAFDVAGFCA